LVTGTGSATSLLVVLFIVFLSYRQTIAAYPGGEERLSTVNPKARDFARAWSSTWIADSWPGHAYPTTSLYQRRGAVTGQLRTNFGDPELVRGDFGVTDRRIFSDEPIVALEILLTN
jgi:hypothetical protein